MNMDDMDHSPQHEKPEFAAGDDAKWIIGGTVVAAVVLALLAYGVAGSYESLTRLAAAHAVPLPRFMPVGLDGGLIGTITLDIVLTWLGWPIGWLRQVARLLALATVVANAWAGWPDPVAVFLRVFAPLMIVVISEAIRTVLLRKGRETRDRIPLSRWVLSPWPTWKLYRRMVLWEMTSYAAAIEMEVSRREAVARLQDRFGAGWEDSVPGNLTWMLSQGVRMPEALRMVAQLTAEPKPQVAASVGGRKRPATGSRKPARNARPAVSPELADLDSESAALRILGEDPEISGSELGRRIGKSGAYGRMLKAKLTHPEHETGPLPRVES